MGLQSLMVIPLLYGLRHTAIVRSRYLKFEDMLKPEGGIKTLKMFRNVYPIYQFEYNWKNPKKVADKV